MTDTAAFQATFSDWKLIKGRKVVQVVLELPIEHADHAYQALGGMPNPANEIWVAVARLNLNAGAGERTAGRLTSLETESVAHNPGGGHALKSHDPTIDETGAAADEPAPRRPRSFTSLPLPQQAALLCGDPVFRAFLTEERNYEPNSPDEAAEALRDICGVTSRADIKPGTSAGTYFTQVREEFMAWKLVSA